MQEHVERVLSKVADENIEIICADGTKSLPEQAPFDTILDSAGGPKVPEPLKQQLAVRGRPQSRFTVMATDTAMVGAGGTVTGTAGADHAGCGAPR